MKLLPNASTEKYLTDDKFNRELAIKYYVASKMVPLSNLNPRLSQRTKSQVKQSEIFYKKVEAMKKRAEPITSHSPSQDSDRTATSDFSGRAGSVRTFSSRGASLLPSYASTQQLTRSDIVPFKNSFGEWIYPEDSKKAVQPECHGTLTTDDRITDSEISRPISISSDEPSNCLEPFEDSCNEISSD